MERSGTKGKRSVLKNYGFLGVMQLIVFSVLFGFAANMAGGPETAVAGRHAAAHHQACCGVPGHLLVGDHYPYQTDEIVRDEDMAVFVTVMG